MRRISLLVIFLTLTIVIAGCARMPSGSSNLTLREMTFHITFNGPINDNYHYFISIDTTGEGLGPVPVFPGDVPGQGWVTGSADFYVEYTQRQYRVYRIISLQPFASEPIGVPVRSTVPGPGGSTLSFTIDLNKLEATGDSVDVNIIAIDDPFGNIRSLDALGLKGSDFINVDIRTDRTITNLDTGPIEIPNDVLDQNGNLEPVTDLLKPLDIVDWSITLDI